MKTAGSGPPETQGMEVERRSGMNEFTERLARLEASFVEELGKPGEDGRLHKRLTGIEDTLDGIETALRGNGGPGITERVRRLEEFRRAGRKSDRSLIDRVQDLELRVRLLIGGLGIVGMVVLYLLQEWARRWLFGGAE